MDLKLNVRSKIAETLISSGMLDSFIEDYMQRHNFLPLANNFEGNAHMVGVCDESRVCNTKRVIEVVPTPTYEQIFQVPKKKDREQGKFYGKDLLKRFFKEQHGVFINNQATVRRWLKDTVFNSICNLDFRHNKVEQNRLKELIRNNISEIKPILLNGETYLWKENDIYCWALHCVQAKRKHGRKKSLGSDIENGELHPVDSQVSTFVQYL